MLSAADPTMPQVDEGLFTSSSSSYPTLSQKGRNFLKKTCSRILKILLEVPGDSLGEYSGNLTMENISDTVKALLRDHLIKQDTSPRGGKQYRIGFHGKYTVDEYVHHLSQKIESVPGSVWFYNWRLKNALKKQSQLLNVENIRPCRVYSGDISIEKWGHPEMDFARMLVDEPSLFYSDIYEALISTYASSGGNLNRELIKFYCLCLAIEKMETSSDFKKPLWRDRLLPIVRNIEAL